MKTNKIAVTLTALVLAIAMVSCTQLKDGTKQSGDTAGSSVPTPQSGAVSQNAEGGSTMKFGKINTVVGNELSLEYCETPEAFKGVEFFAKAPTSEEASKGEDNKGGMMSATTMTPAIAADNGGGDVAMGKVDKNEAPFEVKLTGDKEDITVPAGIELVDMTGNGRTSAADIKDGDVVGVDLRDGKLYGIVLFS